MATSASAAPPSLPVSSAFLTHLSERERVPPHVAVQLSHGDATKRNMSHDCTLHARVVGGPSAPVALHSASDTSVRSADRTHDTCRVDVPPPHVCEHAVQSPTTSTNAPHASVLHGRNVGCSDEDGTNGHTSLDGANG
jgi:hypothetical protein